MKPSLTIIRGDTADIEVQISQDGTPVNITGYTVFFTAKKNLSDADNSAAIKKDITSHSDPTNGKTIVSLAPADTASLAVGKYHWDLQLKSGSGAISSVSKQMLEIVEDVTIRTS